MTHNISSPISSASTRFGWAKPSRIEEFKKLQATPTGATTRIIFQGKNTDIPIIRVPIELPKYRLANGRTVSLQSEFLAKNPKTKKDIFSGDAEMWDAQEIQHGLLLQLATQSDLRKYFEDVTNKQRDPILLTEDGFVLNGNRRLSTWRDLIHNDRVKYEHFRYIDVAIIPHCDEKELDRLEAILQIEKDIKADYTWDAEASMMLAKQKRDGFSNKELAELYGKKENEIQERFDMLSYADDYLRSRNHANMWSEVSSDEYAFREIVRSRQKIAGSGSQEVFKQAAYTIIDNPDETGGRAYQTIPAIVDCLDIIKDNLQREFNVKPAAIDSNLDDLLGGTTAIGSDGPADIPLAKEIQKPENAERTRKIIIEVIESQKQLKKDSKSAYYLRDCCAKAQSILAAAIKDGFHADTKTDGVSTQLNQIETQINKIRQYIETKC